MRQAASGGVPLHMRVGFLFNHDQLHQVGHLLPVALALAESDVGLKVVLATTNRRISAEVRRLAGDRLDGRIELTELAVKSPWSVAASAALEALLPARKLLVYGDNLDFFRTLDVLVVAEKTSLVLKTRYGLDRLRIVHTRHGAGDRAIGFNGASAGFDLVLVAGEVIRERLVREAGVPADRIVTVGYPKFDLNPDRRPSLPMQKNGRPTILYNPHVAPHLSSWYRAGRAVLDYFATSTSYNLIFAPHVMLFHRPVAITIDPPRLHRPGGLSSSIRNAPNIHIDLSSPACTDMTYTMAADIYLGDASSQVYEFLLKPRPCIFLNPNRIDHINDESFMHWKAGQVIDDVEQLDVALRKAVLEPGLFRAAQDELFSSHIELTDELSSCRAARAIANFTATLSCAAHV